MHSHLNKHPALTEAVKHLEKLNPDQFEIYFEHRKSVEIDSKDQEIDTLSRSEDLGLAVRVIKDRKLGFSFTTSFEKQAIQKSIDTAFEMATFMPEDSHIGFYSFGSAAYPEVDQLDTQGLEIPLKDKIELAKSLEGHCRKFSPKITSVRSASIDETYLETHLVDSNGEHIQHKATFYTANITCKADFNGDQQMGGDFGFSNYIDNLNVKNIAELAAEQALELLGAGAAPTLRCPAVLRNCVVADLIHFLAPSFSAEEIDKKRSMLAGKKGQLIFSEKVTLVNDGLLPRGFATAPFDAEGVPTKKITLIDGGFFSETLYDTYHAKKNDTVSSGCAVRGMKTAPSIGYSNLYMEKGKKSFDSLVQGISKGILITDLMGMHTANPVTGEFSLGASGLLIENGKLTRPVRGFAVAGNVLDLFRKMAEMGNDLKFFGKIGAPSVQLTEISVSGV